MIFDNIVNNKVTEFIARRGDELCRVTYEYEYRIKEEPEYRPYKTIEEAFNEAKKHGFWVREKDRKYMSIICRLSTKVIRVNNLDTTKEVVYINGDSSDYLLKNFVWADDNSPCGIKTQ